MVDSSGTFWPRAFRNPTFLLLALGAVSLAAALLVGIGDNPPGIALVFGGMICWTLALVRNWSRPAHFLWLALGALGGFLAFAVLHNLLYGLGVMVEESPFLHGLCQVLHVGAFLLAGLVAPPVLVVGILGFLVTTWRRKRKPALSGT